MGCSDQAGISIQSRQVNPQKENHACHSRSYLQGVEVIKSSAHKVTNIYIGGHRDVKKKIDLNEAMREVLVDGSGLVKSQNQINMDRESQMIGQWKNILKNVSAAALKPSSSPTETVKPSQPGWNQQDKPIR